MFLRIVFGFYLIVIVDAQTVTLHADNTKVSPGHSIYLTCNHDNNPIVTWWRNGDIVLSAEGSDGDCMFSPAAVPPYLTGCSCANSSHTCTLKLTAHTEQWQCSISVRGDVKQSNRLTLEVTTSTSTRSSGSVIGCLVTTSLVYFFAKYR